MAKCFPSLVVFVLLLAPLVAADAPIVLSAPAWDDAVYDTQNETIILTWSPPGNDLESSFLYHVYHNSKRIASTESSRHETALAGSHNVYTVIAERNGASSLPSTPMVVERHDGAVRNQEFMLGIGGSASMGSSNQSSCDFLIIVKNSGELMVGVIIREYCIPFAGNALGGILPNASILSGMLIRGGG